MRPHFKTPNILGKKKPRLTVLARAGMLLTQPSRLLVMNE
jgi:hypothetical protein